MAKYKFIHNGRETICISSYAKKTVKGISKARVEDTYDAQIGDSLAKARCDFKVAEKRVKNATACLAEAESFLKEVSDYYAKMLKYYDDAISERTVAKNNLESLLETL